MKLCKRIIAIFVIAFIIIRTILFSGLTASAAFSAPAVADALEAFIEAVLLATGSASQSQIESMDISQKQTLLNDNLSNGNISLNSFLGMCSNPEADLAEFLTNPYIHIASSVTRSVIDNWLQEAFFDKMTASDFLDVVSNGLYGGVSAWRYINSNGSSSLYVCNSTLYIDVFDGGKSFRVNGKQERIVSALYFYDADGSLRPLGPYVSSNPEIYDPPKLISMSPNAEDFKKYYRFYGDVRYMDESSYSTDDEYEEVFSYDYSDAKDYELLDLIKQILNNMKLEMPDLSSIEGILEAIYYRLGSLDSDNDTNTLSLINSAISRLESSNNSNFNLLIDKLNELMKSKEEVGDEEEEEDPSIDIDGLKDLIEQLIPNIDDMTGTEKVKAAIMAKFSFVEQLKSLIQRFVDSYKSSSSSAPVIKLDFDSGAVSWLAGVLGFHNVDMSGGGVLDKYMPAIRALLAAFIYISFAWNTYRKIPEYISGGGE